MQGRQFFVRKATDDCLADLVCDGRAMLGEPRASAGEPKTTPTSVGRIVLYPDQLTFIKSGQYPRCCRLIHWQAGQNLAERALALVVKRI